MIRITTRILLLFFCTIMLVLSSDAVQAGAADTLDYGFYWFDRNNNAKKGYNESTNRVISVSSTYYSNNKPTVIYFHGWQNGSSKDNYSRESFSFVDSKEGINEITVRAWKDEGWNVAIFYWNQFADENEVKDAEAKIWSASGPRGMRYRLSDGSHKTTYSPNKSVSQLAFDQYKAICKNNTSGEIYFVGHSLGNQLATAAAKKVSDAVRSGSLDSDVMPERLVLLDPFWSKGSKSYIGGKWTGEKVRSNINTMISRHDIAVSWYHTSGILDLWVGDANNALKEVVAYFKPKFWYLSSWQIVEKHTYAPNMWFWTFKYLPPYVTNTGKDGPSASTSTSRIRNMMGSQYYWDQVEGRYSPNPNDDEYKRKNY